MQISKNAFTMIELIFVIVVLGILAAIAVPKFAATRADAKIAKGRTNVSAIRSAIVTERQRWLIRGINTFIKTGIDTETISGLTRKKMDKDGLFGGVLMYPVTSEDWQRGASDVNKTVYTYSVDNTDTTFTYTVGAGTFTCNPAIGTDAEKEQCKRLIN